jgi:hypothetical protein
MTFASAHPIVATMSNVWFPKEIECVQGVARLAAETRSVSKRRKTHRKTYGD